MLMPKKVKHRRVMKGRMRGKATRGENLDFGDFGLKALEAGWITDRQIEAGRIAITRRHAEQLPKSLRPENWSLWQKFLVRIGASDGLF